MLHYGATEIYTSKRIKITEIRLLYINATSDNIQYVHC